MYIDHLKMKNTPVCPINMKSLLKTKWPLKNSVQKQAGILFWIVLLKSSLFSLSELCKVNNSCLVMIRWFLIKGLLGDDFPFEPEWPLQLTMWQGPLLPRPLRRLGLRAVVQASQWLVGTTQPSLSITELNICSRTGDALQRGQCAQTLQPQRERKEPSVVAAIFWQGWTVMRDTHLCH